MLSIRQARMAAFAFFAAAFCCAQVHAQAALLVEQPYGFFGTLNPTGHNAIYFERICAETPVKLRLCRPGEMGAVIARYQGIDGYDWVAIPLIPYLYAVENTSDVPSHVDREIVTRLRNRYRETHLQSLGPHLSAGSIVRGGWTELVGGAYERRIYAFRFHTTRAQDEALMARLNAGPNHTQFNLLFKNCADFARVILNFYFPKTFRRSIFPDAGMTTPKQTAYRLVRYARKHPEAELAIFEIPQIPGYRRESHSNKGIDESFVTTVYAIPIAILNPYLAGGLAVDYLVRGRYHLIPKHPELLGPDNLLALTAPATPGQNSVSTAAKPSSAASNSGAHASAAAGASVGSSAGVCAASAVSRSSAATQTAAGANSNLKGIGAANE